jgi:hypothetical protein
MRRFAAWVLVAVVGCADQDAPVGDTSSEPVAPVGELPFQAPPPVQITLDGPDFLLTGAVSTFTVTGTLGEGERVYFYATSKSGTTGPCLSAAGGLCLDIRKPGAAVGSAVVDANGTARFNYTPNVAWGNGATVRIQALVVRSVSGVDSLKSGVYTETLVTGPPEGTPIPNWAQIDITTTGVRDGCVGGETWVKSSSFVSPRYVAVTRCADEHEYKIWLSDNLYGTFAPTADWSGNGEDMCEYVGGEFVSHPSGSSAVDPNVGCWSRGAAGATPTYERVCANNRWMPPVSRCSVAIPGSGGPAEGSSLSNWMAFDFYDNGYRDSCAGGAKYIKSTPYASPKYVATTLCSDDTYKIWLGNSVYGVFVSPGDWSGTGEDHCEYVGGSHVAFPTAPTAVGANQPCWSRGAAGAAPVYESACANNRWVPDAQQCNVQIP